MYTITYMFMFMYMYSYMYMYMYMSMHMYRYISMYMAGALSCATQFLKQVVTKKDFLATAYMTLKNPCRSTQLLQLSTYIHA